MPIYLVKIKEPPNTNMYVGECQGFYVNRQVVRHLVAFKQANSQLWDKMTTENCFLSTHHPSCMVRSWVLVQSGQSLVLKVLLLTPSLSRVMKFYLIDYVPRTQMSRSNVHCLRKLECKLSLQVGLCLSQVDSPTTPSPKKFLLSPSLATN